MPEAATGCVFLKKDVLKNFIKFTGKSIFNNVAGLSQLFLQNNSIRLLLECRHCKNETREIDCLCCREVDARLIAFAKREGSLTSSSFYGDLCSY